MDIEMHVLLAPKEQRCPADIGDDGGIVLRNP